MTDRVAWANTWHQHLTNLVDGNLLAADVLELHKPDEHGDCRGCDAEGYEWEPPEYGCSTVQLIAGMFGLTLEMKCPACGGYRRTLTTGGPVGHHRRDGDMWVSCPGSTEVVEALPCRSEAEAMAEFTERMAANLSAAVGRMETSLGLVSPIPTAVEVHAVKKWAHEVKVGEALFRR